MILKNNYYCFIAGLPEVFLDDRKLALSVNGFRELAREALKKEDVKLMELFFLPADNKQVLRLLNKMAPDTNLETVYPLQCLEDEITEPTNSLPVSFFVCAIVFPGFNPASHSFLIVSIDLSRILSENICNTMFLLRMY